MGYGDTVPDRTLEQVALAKKQGWRPGDQLAKAQQYRSSKSLERNRKGKPKQRF